MNKTSIVILSYNTYSLTKNCIESIRIFTDPDMYEIIVVDNGSKDQSVAWLKDQTDIKLIVNTENKGFPGGCNQGMSIAEAGNDILLLNSDTIVTPRWLQNLQTALYSSERVGAVSCVTNSCSNWQQIDVNYSNIDELIAFADEFNHSDEEKWELRLRLVGFCYLIKNQVYKEIGFLDEIFSPGNYEDDDYSLRIIMTGRNLLLCKDTFIHHYGSASFSAHSSQEEQNAKINAYNELLKKNEEKFLNKWNITDRYSSLHAVVYEVDEPLDTSARIIVIGCNAGMDLFFLKAKYPDAVISGITENQNEALLARNNFRVDYCINTETEVFSFLSEQYDYILLADEQKKYKDFEGYIDALMPYLAPQGSIHISGDKPE